MKLLRAVIEGWLAILLLFSPIILALWVHHFILNFSTMSIVVVTIESACRYNISMEANRLGLFTVTINGWVNYHYTFNEICDVIYHPDNIILV